MKKIAIVLFNLGGPDKPDAVKPFLFNLFNDKAIIGAPGPIRYLLAKFISSRREEEAKKIYSHIGDKSPILPLTQEQAKALEALLVNQNTHYKIFIAMRYWHPFIEESVKEVKAYDPDSIILLPLYPQFSTTTTGSSYGAWNKAAAKEKLKKPTRLVCCYPREEKFIKAHAELIKLHYEKALDETGKNPRILFSAHGLPKKIIEKGDPYQWQVEQTAEAVMKEFSALMGTKSEVSKPSEPSARSSAKDSMSVAGNNYKICYQSRVGPLEWIGPSTEDEIIRAVVDKAPVILVPIAFVSEHSETLVELDIEYRELAEKHGLEGYYRVPALGTHPLYMEALAEICRNITGTGISSCEGKRSCPAEFIQCLCRG